MGTSPTARRLDVERVRYADRRTHRGRTDTIPLRRCDESGSAAFRDEKEVGP
jgi:hypothetical protein